MKGAYKQVSTILVIGDLTMYRVRIITTFTCIVFIHRILLCNACPCISWYRSSNLQSVTFFVCLA